MTLKRFVPAAAVALLLVFVSLLPAVSRDEYSVFPPDVFPELQRPLSRFTHDDHMAFDTIEDCYVCHHLYADGELVEGESSEDTPCGDCHKLDPDDGGTDRLRAYHNRCKGCHERLKAGPIACGECHVRR
jgi:hypothetical protein